MKYCSNCGNQITEKDKFCSECGFAVNNQNNTEIEKQMMLDDKAQITQNKNLAGNTIKGIGIALVIIGLIVGVFSIIFIVGSGEILGYDSWDYDYAGGRDIGVWSAILAGVSLLVGICMLIGYKNSKK